MELKIIGRIKSDIKGKFGIPRQSGIAESLISYVVFEKEFGVGEAFRGIEEYSHLWIIWNFSLEKSADFSPTVRPPKLGGNRRVGVFATRSPNRPNSIGLSVVRLLGVVDYMGAKALKISGGDMADGTPVFDVKPYIPFVDCKTDATGSFTEQTKEIKLEVNFPSHLQVLIERDKLDGLFELLALDPRPGYHTDPERIYGFDYAEKEVKFKCDGKTVTVVDVV